MRFPLTGAELLGSWKSFSPYTESSLLMSHCFFVSPPPMNLGQETLLMNWCQERSLYKLSPLTRDKDLTVIHVDVGGGLCSSLCLFGGLVQNLVGGMKLKLFFFSCTFTVMLLGCVIAYRSLNTECDVWQISANGHNSICASFSSSHYIHGHSFCVCVIMLFEISHLTFLVCRRINAHCCPVLCIGIYSNQHKNFPFSSWTNFPVFPLHG